MGLVKWIDGPSWRVRFGVPNGIVGIQVESGELEYDWEMGAQGELAYIQERLASTGPSEAERKELEGKEKVLEYGLPSRLNRWNRQSRESMMMDTSGFAGVVLLFTVIVAAGIVASEFSQGTD